jgi:hypothetical protein
MCQALKAHGVPTNHLLALGPNNTASPFGSEVVVATAAIRNQFGSRLASVYAPAVLASFGSGNARIDVRVIAPHGAATYLDQVRADQQLRKSNSAALLTLPGIVISPSATSQLATGQVDSRLIVLLAWLAPTYRLDVVAFGDSGPGSTAGMPLRSVTLTGTTANLRSILAYVRTHETAVYLPTYAQIIQRTRRSELVMEFSAPSPLELFENTAAP